MRILILLIPIVLLIIHPNFGQINLVPNPEFEEYEDCPSEHGNIESTSDWFRVNPDGSPDYFNRCINLSGGTFPTPDVPSNGFGYQDAKSGDGYAGIFVYGYDTREYIQVRLDSPLEIGETYLLSMYVSVGDVKWGISELGMYLSDEPTEGTGWYFLLDVEPQVKNDPNTILSDTAGWTLISGIYVAEGGEEYLTIGNFVSDSLTYVEEINGDPLYRNQSYLYIEDVSVIKLNNVSTTDLDQKQVSIYPNPSRDYVTIKSGNSSSFNEQFDVFDINGKLVSSYIMSNDGNGFRVDISDLTTGVYIYKTSINNKEIISGRLIKI